MSPQDVVTTPRPVISRKIKRSAEIALFLLKYGGREFMERWGLARFLPSHAEVSVSEKAVQLREDITALGPTFVKLGQLLSTRADLLPPEILKKLALLQDNVEPISYEEVQQIIEQELGAPIVKLFNEFDQKPLGSASLGQVHFAVMRSGQRVGVKVQRPNIRPLIENDMAVLRDFAQWLDKKTKAGRRYRFSKIQEEFERTLIQELDYETEAQNLIRLKDNLQEFEDIIVPSPIEDYSTSRVLTMEYVEGRKLTHVSPLTVVEVNGEKIADSLLQAYLQQIFVDGFFHADPHPGNIFLLNKNKVALIDLGMVGIISPVLRRRLLQLLPSLYRQDPDGVADVVLEISEADENVNRMELIHAYTGLLQTTVASNLQRVRISEALFGVMRVSAQAGVHLPAEINLLGRTMLHLDRIGQILAPQFNFNQAIEQHIDDIIQQQMLKDVSPRSCFKSLIEAKDFIERLPNRANRFVESLLDRKLGFHIDLVPDVHLLENLQKIANRITIGLILAALIVGASQFMQVQTRFMLFGYPGFAMICFLSALAGALVLIFQIIRSDRRTRNETTNGKT